MPSAKRIYAERRFAMHVWQGKETLPNVDASLDQPVGLGEDTLADVVAVVAPTQERRALQRETLVALRDALRFLSPERARAVALHLTEACSLEEAGDLVGLTRERIRQLEAAVLRDVRSKLGIARQPEARAHDRIRAAIREGRHATTSAERRAAWIAAGRCANCSGPRDLPGTTCSRCRASWRRVRERAKALREAR